METLFPCKFVKTRRGGRFVINVTRLVIPLFVVENTQYVKSDEACSFKVGNHPFIEVKLLISPVFL
jgi:hypothetical protein